MLRRTVISNRNYVLLFFFNSFKPRDSPVRQNKDQIAYITMAVKDLPRVQIHAEHKMS